MQRGLAGYSPWSFSHLAPREDEILLFFFSIRLFYVASLVDRSIKNLPVMQETQDLFLSLEDSLEKEMATHSSILVWRILWTEESGRPQFIGSEELDMT